MMVADTQAGDAVELLPCPFCGWAGVGPAFVCEQGQWDIWQIECGNCGFALENEIGKVDARQACIDRWNTRIASRASALDEAVEAVRGALSWIEAPFINEETGGDELRDRIGFCLADAERALAKIKEAGGAAIG